VVDCAEVVEVVRARMERREAVVNVFIFEVLM